jgi:hypothetical protein
MAPFSSPPRRRLIHRLIDLRCRITPGTVLNPGPSQNGTSAHLAADLNRLSKQLEADAYDLSSGRVDYAALKTGSTFTAYREIARGLRRFDPASLSTREDRLAFWINLYNALILDAVIRFDVCRTVEEIPGFFWRAAYYVGGHRFNAFDIEYGVLRANGSHPGIPGPQFGRGDPRRAFSLQSLDPRIHFALVCAADSCPPIAAYDPAQIDVQLDAAAAAFINNGGVEIDRARGEIRLSKIFQWYAPDFDGRILGLGDRRPILAYLAPYLADPEDRAFLEGSNVSVRFLDYSWGLNKLKPAPVSI